MPHFVDEAAKAANKRRGRRRRKLLGEILGKPLRNVEAFCATFDVKAGDQMYRPPSERTTIW